MKLTEEADKIFKNKIKDLEKEIVSYFDEDNQESMLLVLFTFIQIKEFIHLYLKEHPNSYTFKEDDDIELEDDNLQEYAFTYSAKNMLPIYLEVLSHLFTTYDYTKYANYTSSAYHNMTIHNLQKEKELLIQKLSN